MAYFEERSLHVLVVSEKNNEHFMTVAPKWIYRPIIFIYFSVSFGHPSPLLPFAFAHLQVIFPSSLLQTPFLVLYFLSSTPSSLFFLLILHLLLYLLLPPFLFCLFSSLCISVTSHLFSVSTTYFLLSYSFILLIFYTMPPTDHLWT
jgi:hypothetical protein